MRTHFIALTAAALLCSASIANAETTVTRTSDGASTTVTTKSTDGSTTHSTTRTTYFNSPLDMNHNGIIDSTEFSPYVYSAWDLNHDGNVSQEEWAAVSGRWYAGPTQTEYRTYKYWDKNGDGRITSDEVNTNITATKIYGAWDINNDNIIQPEEYAAATFRQHDLDGDGAISITEWTNTQ